SLLLLSLPPPPPPRSPLFPYTTLFRSPPPRAIVPPMGVDVTLTGQLDANQAHTILHPGLTPAALGVTAATPPARATGPARAPWHDEARGAHPPAPFLLPCRLRPPARGVPTLRFRHRRCPGGPGRAG